MINFCRFWSYIKLVSNSMYIALSYHGRWNKGSECNFPLQSTKIKAHDRALELQLVVVFVWSNGSSLEVTNVFSVKSGVTVAWNARARPDQRRGGIHETFPPDIMGKTLHLLPSLGDHLAMYICRSEWINEIVYLKSKHVLWDIFNKSRSLWERQRRLRYNLWRRAPTSPCPVQLHQLGWQAQTIAFRFKQRHLLRCVGTHSAKTREN